MELCFVTSNEGKVSEASQILDRPLTIVKLELPEIQSLDLNAIVEAKVQAAYDQVQKPVFVDDVGLFIKCWNGFPGPFVKFLLDAGGTPLLLKMAKSEEIRTVVAKAAIGYHDGENVHTFIGEVKGQLVAEPRGENGWGWDPVFQPEHSALTYAEMGETEKNKISHRRAALEKFKDFLKQS